MGLIDKIRGLFNNGGNTASEDDRAGDNTSVGALQDVDTIPKVPIENLAIGIPSRSETRGGLTALGTRSTLQQDPLEMDRPQNAHSQLANQPPVSSSESPRSEYVAKIDEVSKRAMPTASPAIEKLPVKPHAISEAPTVNSPKKQPAPRPPKLATDKPSKPKAPGPKPEKKAVEKPKRVMKRPPDEYYPDTYVLNSITMYADEYDEVSDIEKIKPAEVSVAMENGSIRLVAGETSLGDVSGYVHSELL